MNILDFGSGTSLNLAEVLYRNRYKPNKYLGLDIRKLNKKGQALDNKCDWLNFEIVDLCNSDLKYVGCDWDIITSFEVIEHIGKPNSDKFLSNISLLMNDKTVLLLSTPVYNENVGAASNHIINGEIGEFKFDELKQLLEKYFVIENVWGTFASQRDYKNELSGTLKELFDRARGYYDSHLLSNLMAPLIDPRNARNCIWRCIKK
jgi:2-polyprenyl-3-methyl-5-hydroxy-6-metoxy-1,4-benzoquinol methylase